MRTRTCLRYLLASAGFPAKMAHYYSARFPRLDLGGGRSGSGELDISAAGDEGNEYWLPALAYKVYYPIIAGLILVAVILLLCACMGWTHCCTVYRINRKKRDREVRQLENGIVPREDREKTTIENGAVLNGHRPESLERAGGDRDGVEMVEAELHAEWQIDHNDTSPHQAKASGSKSKAFKPAPLSILPPGETYTSDTLPSETMHAAGKTAVSPKSATFPERTSPRNTEPQSMRRVKTKPAPPTDHRFSDRTKPQPAAKDLLARRPRSVETSEMTPAAPEVKRISKDYQETTPGDHSPRVQGGYYNSLKQRQSLTLVGKETDD